MFNPFGLFQIAPSFDIDLDDLHKRYGALQAVCHPDRQALGLDKDLLQKKSMEITRAYEVLKSPLKRALCLLELNGFPQDLEDRITDPELLTDIMDLQEKYEEGTLQGHDLLDMQHQTYQNLKTAFDRQEFAAAQAHVHRYQFLLKIETSYAAATL